MSFRTRIALATALAVAVAVGLASAGAYVLVRDALVDELDRSLEARIERAPRPGPGTRLDLGGPGTATQLVSASGEVRTVPGLEPLPVSATARAVAGGTVPRAIENVATESGAYRVLTIPLRPGVAIQLGRPRDDVDAALARTRRALAMIGLAGVAFGALLGLLVSRAAIGPLARLTVAAEDVASTGDLSRRVGISGDDEIGRLGHRFDAMLGTLEASEHARRQLVADASHELRTPITSVRTNIELVRRHPELSPAEQAHALDAALTELDELAALVTDVVELARDGSERSSPPEEIRLDELVQDVVARARRASPSLNVVLDASPSVVLGVRDRLHRAVANMVDNARKWSPDAGVVDVASAEGWVRVRDHGPGFDPADLPHVFDRFYRSAAARGTPGSGLGLAIVHQVAEGHGGTVTAENAPDGGAVVTLRLPATRVSTNS